LAWLHFHLVCRFLVFGIDDEAYLLRPGRIDFPTVVNDLCSPFCRWSWCRVCSLPLSSIHPFIRSCSGILLLEQVPQVLLELSSGGNSASLVSNSALVSLRYVFSSHAELSYLSFSLLMRLCHSPSPNLFSFSTTEHGVLFSPSCELRSFGKLIRGGLRFALYISRNQ